MPRPTVLPRWGTDESNEVTPSSGDQDTGWVNGAMAVSSYANWLARLTYDYLAYLDDRLHGSNTIVIPASAGSQATSSPTASPTGLVGSVSGDLSGGARWIVPIGAYLPVGSRITEVRVIVEDNAGVTTRAAVHKMSHDVGSANQGSPVQIGSDADSDESGDVQSLTPVTGATEVVAADSNYAASILALAAGTVEVHAVEVDYDRPEL